MNPLPHNGHHAARGHRPGAPVPGPTWHTG